MQAVLYLWLVLQALAEMGRRERERAIVKTRHKSLPKVKRQESHEPLVSSDKYPVMASG